MKNKEKYAKEIVEIACNGYSIAISKKTGHVAPCEAYRCADCMFCKYDCHEKTREWAESEYIEKPVISKRDRAFLEYIDKKFTYITRNHDGWIHLFVVEPRKDKMTWTSGYLSSTLSSLNIDLPMIKWENKEPWLIEDLKKLEVVDEY